MLSSKKIISVAITALLLTGCQTGGKNNNDYFTYQTTPFTATLGEGRNSDDYNYDLIKVNPISNLRSDFAMGVDASMVAKVEEHGGIYYNEEGVEQDVFEIMADNGVNFFRVRIWNNPQNIFGVEYGGGSVDTALAISMAKRAQRANMNILVDLHYSDFWADPANQRIPNAWASMTITQLDNAVEAFTKDTLQAFKDAGVNVQAVQIGNEINNGFLFPIGKLDWANQTATYSTVSRLIKAGIRGAKSVNKNILTMLHLAEGGSYDVFNAFFTAMQTNNVNYDIIGASYYPFYHGSLANLKHNLDTVSAKFNKPVIVAEMSYGYTVDANENAQHIYNTQMEDAGSYITSIQGQATALHDVIEVLADVPENRGLGIFYWEPAWLPVAGAGWATAEGQAWVETGDGYSSDVVAGYTDGKATWSNQGLFNFNGRMLPSLKTFALVRGEHAVFGELATRARTALITVTLNSAINETLPATYLVETNLDAIRSYPVVWDATEAAKLATVGTYTVPGVVAGQFNVLANVTVIENYVKDPSFENQGASDRIVEPWIATSSTHSDKPNNVVKLNRKAGDVLNGSTSLNWYHGSAEFHFKVEQEINLTNSGSYSLSAYLMAIKPSEIAHSMLQIYVINTDGVKSFVDMKGLVKGWGTFQEFYVKGEVEFSVVTPGTIKIGLEGRAPAAAWGHADEFSLVKV